MTTRKIVFSIFALLFGIGVMPVSGKTRPNARETVTTIAMCGTTISAPGVYALVGNVTGCSGDGIDVTAGGVTIELGGYILEGCGYNCGLNNVGIRVSDPSGGPLQNVKILGPGEVEDFANGISFVGVQDSQVTGVIGFNGTNYCLSLSADSKGDPSERDVFTGNNFGHCGSVDILGEDVSSSSFIGNACSDDFGGTGVGIQVLNGTGNLLSGNTCNDSTIGIELGGTGSTGTTGNVVVGNTTTGNVTGILVGAAANSNTFRLNYSYYNTSLDIDDSNAHCGSDAWKRNVFSTANQKCIH